MAQERTDPASPRDNGHSTRHYFQPAKPGGQTCKLPLCGRAPKSDLHQPPSKTRVAAASIAARRAAALADDIAQLENVSQEQKNLIRRQILALAVRFENQRDSFQLERDTWYPDNGNTARIVDRRRSE